jgi:hypothetical protein
MQGDPTDSIHIAVAGTFRSRYAALLLCGEGDIHGGKSPVTHIGVCVGDDVVSLGQSDCDDITTGSGRRTPGSKGPPGPARQLADDASLHCRQVGLHRNRHWAAGDPYSGSLPR